MPFLPPHENYELESSGLCYKLFCGTAFGPFPDEGIAGDLFIIADRGSLLYKDVSTAHRRGHWRPALDGHIILHPFEPSYRLVVTFDHMIQWSKHEAQITTFKDAIPVMAEKTLRSYRLEEAGRNRVVIKDD